VWGGGTDCSNSRFVLPRSLPQDRPHRRHLVSALSVSPRYEMFDEASSIDATCPMASVQSLHLEGNLVRERFLSAVASGIFDRVGHPSFEPLIFSTSTTSELGMVSTQNPTGRRVSMPQLCGEMHPRGKLDGWLGSPSHGTYVSRDGKKWGIPSTFDRFWGVHWIRQQDLGRTLPPRIRTIEQGSQRGVRDSAPGPPTPRSSTARGERT